MGTPPEVVRRLHDETARILKKPEVRERLIALGVDPLGMGLPETAAYMKSEVANWARAVKISGASAD